MNSTLCYLNGDYLPLSEARISPLDRGFLFGDGGYEVIPVYARRPFRYEEHMRRLQATLDGLRLPNPCTPEEWRGILGHLIREAEFPDQSLYIQITRGADVKRDPAFPQEVKPTVFAFATPLASPSPKLRQTGIAAITADDIRWGRCDLKAITLLPNILLRQQATEAGCAETILLRDGFVTEGTASSVFVVKNGVVLAPPQGRYVLAGITYDVVIELAAQYGVPHEIRPVSEAELRSADEVWVTSSSKGVLSVTHLDGEPVGDGQPGPMARQMFACYSLLMKCG
ncbi:D-amino acid aminotransferase [Propionivibrio limicola]|uniref:D-amino acid aminotransferase n=1 Tax=Propionivibrio limicola TaxID=167645 RepID=UPI001290C113|nr:D-amino acid aminotransferase [Propionivibrio limicola]